ncbi:MAG TPA: MauE/DoxX family redox-associated membrane protein [Roseiflexaceae bacterium]|nr:MauE/DoxX family redox-associated membrane protein [Roseiflexaceae bacterium]
MWPLSQPMDAIATIGALFLAGVFALAAISKGRDRSAAQAALQAFGLPEPFVTAGYAVLLGGECIVVLALVIPGARLAGAWAALAALTLFTLAMLMQLARGRRPVCACFGTLSQAQVGWKSVARNLALALLASLVVLQQGYPALFGTLARLAWPWLVLAGWAAVSAAWLVLLTRQNGRLLLRIDDLEHNRGPLRPALAKAVAIGDQVPSLGIRDVYGRPFDLARYRGQPLVLLFLEATCAHCRPLLQHVRRAQHSGATLIVVSATPEIRHELPLAVTVLDDPAWSTLPIFELRGTPAAVALDGDGCLAGGVVHGTTAVAALIDRSTPQEVRHDVAPI